MKSNHFPKFYLIKYAVSGLLSTTLVFLLTQLLLLSLLKIHLLFQAFETCLFVSYCDHSPSVGVRQSVHNFLVNNLASININKSAPNLVRMYMTIRSRMSSIMEVIRQELSELSALELENLPYFHFGGVKNLSSGYGLRVSMVFHFCTVKE